tara:strand:+ start:86347 stop:86751 length:405 start_codon:yes stop_codon:yes gene_type:complete
MLKITKILALAFSLVITTVLAGEAPQISQQAFLEALKVPNNNIVLLDVRTAEEYNEGHIAGAINISHNAIEENLKQLTQYKNSTVVVYCRSGHRAGIAANILSSNGFTNLQHLTGDMNGWIEAKLPVVNSEHKH